MGTEIKLASKIKACNKYFTWSREQIAAYCKVSVETVNKILGENKDGKRG